MTKQMGFYLITKTKNPGISGTVNWFGILGFASLIAVQYYSNTLAFITVIGSTLK